MDSIHEFQQALAGLSDRALAALMCASAERLLPVYDAAGNGDPDVLREAVTKAWLWVDGGALPDVEDCYGTLDEYAEAHYSDGDEILGGICASVLAALDAVRRHASAEACRDAVARGLLGAAEVARHVDAALEDAGDEPVAEVEDDSWRAAALALVHATSAEPWGQRLAALRGAPPWVQTYLCGCREA